MVINVDYVVTSVVAKDVVTKDVVLKEYIIGDVTSINYVIVYVDNASNTRETRH